MYVVILIETKLISYQCFHTRSFGCECARRTERRPPPHRSPVQGYLAHKKTPPPRTLQYDCAQGYMVVLGGRAVSYERGAPVDSKKII